MCVARSIFNPYKLLVLDSDQMPARLREWGKVPLGTNTLFDILPVRMDAKIGLNLMKIDISLAQMVATVETVSASKIDEKKIERESIELHSWNLIRIVPGLLAERFCLLAHIAHSYDPPKNSLSLEISMWTFYTCDFDFSLRSIRNKNMYYQ